MRASLTFEFLIACLIFSLLISLFFTSLSSFHEKLRDFEFYQSHELSSLISQELELLGSGWIESEIKGLGMKISGSVEEDFK